MYQPETNQKLIKIIKAKNPNLGNDEIDKLTDQFSELGLFLVRLFLKQRSKPPKTLFSTEFEEKPEKVPP